MARTRFRSDAGLTARMSTVMLLLGGLYVSVFVALAYFTNLSGGFVLFLAAAFGLGQWYFSDKIALAAMRARVVTPEEAPELHGMIDRLCALADMPKPTVAIADTDVPNAFATGRSPQPLSRLRDDRASCGGSTPTSSRACCPTSCPTSPTATSW